MKLQSQDRRVQRFIARHKKSPAYQWDDVQDPRARRGRRWPFEQLLDAAFLGMVAGCATLRDVEAQTDEMGQAGRAYVARRVPDTTLYELLGRLGIEELRKKLRQQVRSLYRAKSLEPEALPCGVVSIDGKGIGTLEHDAEATAQKAHHEDGSPYWLVRALRAVLTSSEARPCIDQMPVAAKTNEMGDFPAFFDGLEQAYGRLNLFEIVTVDAGMTSKKNAEHIHGAHRAYVMALKETQPELLREAERLLRPRTQAPPAAETPWEKAQGKQVRRRLYRTTEIAGYHEWTHLQQAWLVVQETLSADGTIAIEDRFFLTSVRPGRLSAAQILLVVRGHWRIENDCFWSLDTQWGEDDRPWRSTGRAVEVVSFFRLMAYNLLQLARQRHLRPRRAGGRPADPPPWRRMFEWTRQALRLALDPPLAPASGIG
jgi:hypothetical protein